MQVMSLKFGRGYDIVAPHGTEIKPRIWKNANSEGACKESRMFIRHFLL
jgi:hypothetical protein